MKLVSTGVCWYRSYLLSRNDAFASYPETTIAMESKDDGRESDEGRADGKIQKYLLFTRALRFWCRSLSLANYFNYSTSSQCRTGRDVGKKKQSDEDDDEVAFVGSRPDSIVHTDEPKSSDPVLFLNTQLAKQLTVGEVEGEEAFSYQQQVAPVTVSSIAPLLPVVPYISRALVRGHILLVVRTRLFMANSTGSSVVRLGGALVDFLYGTTMIVLLNQPYRTRA